jgi:hypothetical protein
MADQQSPPPLTLTPKPTPPDNLSGEKLETLPPTPSSGTLRRVPGNPFRVDIPQAIKEANKRGHSEAISEARASFRYNPSEPIVFDEASFGHSITTHDFNSAVNVVISTIDKGYTPVAYPVPLSPSEWARLSCKLLTAVGRGYRRTSDLESEQVIDKAKAEAIDATPLGPKYPTLFHRIAVTASDIETHVSTDQDGYKEWYVTLKETFNQKAAKAAMMEVEEKWRLWKAEQIEKRATAQEVEISAAVRNRNARYLFTAAEELGLSFAPQNATADLFSTPTTGKKRTISGTIPARGPDTPIPLRISLPRAAKRTPSPADTPRGSTIAPMTLAGTRADPSPTPRPKKTLPNPQTPLDLGTNTSRNTELRRPPVAQQAKTPSEPRGDPSIVATLQLILTRLETLEKNTTRATRDTTSSQTAAADKPPPVQSKEAATGSAPTEGFTMVNRTKPRNKGKGKTPPGKAPPAQPTQINITPASYAQAASMATDVRQPTAPKANVKLPGITEVTVLRTGGHTDSHVEQCIRARAADAIVREVRLNMTKAVAKPIPLKAGRWSINSHSKGNFVYSFDGCIPFDIVASYEHILLGPFQGSGQLRPSLGWTRLLAHGVPTRDEVDNIIYGPEELLREVRTMPGLKKAHLAMEPRWLRPVEGINGAYSTITFAVSDPDGTITNMLSNDRAALFGKEVTIRRWIDKPALVQCSRCHALGHIKTSRACPLGRNSVKCFICGGSHNSEDHNSICPRKHAIAGVCDCKNYKCLNCQQVGHHCRAPVCPAREGYRPRYTRKAGKNKNKSQSKGKEKETSSHWPTWPGQEEMEAAFREKYGMPPPSKTLNPIPDLGVVDTLRFFDDHTDPYAHIPEDEPDDWTDLMDEAPSGQVASGSGLQPTPVATTSTGMVIDSPDARSQEPAPMEPHNQNYSPSHPQRGAASRPLN